VSLRVDRYRVRQVESNVLHVWGSIHSYYTPSLEAEWAQHKAKVDALLAAQAQQMAEKEAQMAAQLAEKNAQLAAKDAMYKARFH
jgi:hypothetical protein